MGHLLPSAGAKVQGWEMDGWKDKCVDGLMDGWMGG